MKARIAEILAANLDKPDRKGERESLVLPLLRQVQHEFGYIPAEAIRPIARFARVPESHIYGVASFYAHFTFNPRGRNVITVCRGTACHVRKSGSLLDDLRTRLGIDAGETTPDLAFTLETVACFGSCALAPVIVINGVAYGRMSRTKMLRMIDNLAAAPASVECRV